MVGKVAAESIGRIYPGYSRIGGIGAFFGAIASVILLSCLVYSMDYDDDWEDLPEHVLNVIRLYPEEEPAVSVSLQLTRDELEEAPRRTKMPPLSDDEQPNPPEKVLDAEPDEALDDPAITDRMKSSDDYISNAFLKLNKEKLLRPWDDIDKSDEKV